MTARSVRAFGAAALFPALTLAAARPLELAPPVVHPVQQDTISVTDDEGLTLLLEAPPSRIVSLLPAATEILFALEAGGRLVGRTRFDTHPPEALEIPSVGDGVRPSVEMIMTRRPDLVILFSGPDSRAAADALRGVGISVLAVRHNTLEDLDRNIWRLGRIVGKQAEAAKLSSDIRRDLTRINQIAGQMPKRSVYYDAWWHPPITIGRGSYLDSLITLAGGRNVFGDLKAPSPQVSLEAIADRRPDLILYPVHRGVEERAPVQDRPGWEVLSAVREGRIRMFDGEVVVRLGPGIGAAVRELAAAIHPGAFFLSTPPARPEDRR